MGARQKLATHAALGAAILLACQAYLQHTAEAHGISGNRFFPGKMAFDDPAVADELLFELSQQQRPGDDGDPVRDTSLAWSFMRLLTPDIGIGFDNTIRTAIASAWMTKQARA